MYDDAKKLLVAKRYTSISELVRDALRKVMYEEEITENGFTRKFEEAVLRFEAETQENDIVLTTDKEVDNYFRYLKLPHNKK